MRILVSLTLLFELAMISGHAVPFSEPDKSSSDIYEVQESGKQKTTFFAPKPDKPTLREIVYYHVIERPYGGLKLERQSEPAKIEMDDTMRPFTNGHGYQFADNNLNETDNHDSSDAPDANLEDTNDEEDHENTSDEGTGEAETSTPESIPDENTENKSEDPVRKEKISDITNKKLTNEKREITTEMTTKQPKSTTPSEDKKNKIRQRQFLFDRLRERYSATFKKTTTTEIPIVSSTEKVEIMNSTEKNEPSTTAASTISIPAAKVKRSVNYEEIPIAPTLPSIDYNKYPGLQVFREPVYETGKPEDTNTDDLKKAMKFKINDIFATMKPYNDDDYETATHKPESRMKSYGMNLSDDQGNVWNNMWRPINYHVGEPVKVYEINEYQVSTITPLDEVIATQETTTTHNSKDLDDVFVDTKKETTTPTKDIDDIYVEGRKDKVKHKATEKPEPKRDLDEEFEQYLNGEKSETDDMEAIASKSLKPKKKSRKEKPSKGTKPDLYEQLIKSDKFWKWLAEWTSNYMEILSDRVKNMVKEEVAKEIKKIEKVNIRDVHLNKTKDENKPNNTDIVENKEPVIKNDTIIIDGKEIPITNTTNFEGNVTLNKDFLRKHRDRDEKPNNNKLNETNFETNKNISSEVTPNITKNEENYNTVKAHNIYGSSTGNDQVTNVFIFYPGTETEKIIDGLKPFMGNINSGIATDIKDKDNKKEDKITEKPLASKDPENITTLKPVENNNINNNEEKLPINNKNTTKIEATKEKEVEKPDSHDSKESVTENKKDATETTEKVKITSTTEMPKSPEAANSTKIISGSTEPTTILASTDKSTEKSLDSTTSASTDTSSEKPIATTPASYNTITEKSDSVDSSTLASTEPNSTTNKTS